MAVIGKNIIENLTTGMYEDSKIIYREYIQNSADAIDKAVKDGLLQKDEAFIDIEIDEKNRKIVIKDNATGIPKDEFVKLLSDIANSTKDRNENKGFRGIGRLAGLAFCKKFIFESSYSGESRKSIMIWNAEELKELLYDNTTHIEAGALIDKVIKIEDNEEDINKHYFCVILENINEENSDLLNVELIREYLEEVAPVEYKNTFIYRNKIYDYAKQENFKIYEYQIKVNGENIYKEYKSDLYDKNNNRIDKITDIQFEKIEKDNILYGWFWYGLCSFQGRLTKNNKMRGIRLRKANIQIGESNTLHKLFKEDRGNFYYVGELHIVCNDLIPNARRDYFIENTTCKQFETIFINKFKDKLHKLYYLASEYRSANKRLEDNLKQQSEIKTKEENRGFLHSKDRENSLNKLEKLEEELPKLKNDISKLKERHSNDEVINKIFESIEKKYESKEDVDNKTQNKNENKTKMNYKANKLSKLTRNERKIVTKILEIIEKKLQKNDAEKIIDMIMEELQK